MADASKPNNKINRADKGRRKARDCFHSKRTKVAINEALQEVPGITDFDHERIVAQLFEHIVDFRSIQTTKQGRIEMVSWVVKQARLIVMLRDLLQEIRVDADIVTLLFTRLTEFSGKADDAAGFQEWVLQTIARQAEGLMSLATWIRVYAGAVRAGIWAILTDCRDLEGCIDDVADELFSKVWFWISEHALDFVDSQVPLHNRFFKLAKSYARSWKSNRLDEIADGVRPKPISTFGLEELEARIAYYAGSGKLPPRPIVLGPGDEGVSELVHPELADLEDFDKPLEWEIAASPNGVDEVEIDESSCYLMAA